MLKINELARLHLGVQGENLSRTIEIDMGAWVKLYPNATAEILHKRHGDQTKALTGATYDSDTMVLSWTPTEYDTFYEGYGEAEIRMVEDDVVKKTKDLIVTAVCPSVIDGSGTVVQSDYQAFLDSVIGYKNGANTAKLAAEDAQEAAETAQGKAEDAQQAAEDAADEAAALISVADVAGAEATTLDPGESATAEITTTGEGKKFLFGIPKGAQGDPGPAGKDGQDGQDGQDGTNAYVYIRYAASQPAQDSDMKTTPDAWIGIYGGSAATAPAHYTDYAWYKIKGADGEGAVAGISMNGSAVTIDGNGIAQLGTVITDVSGKLDTSKVYAGTDKNTTGFALDASIGKILNDKDTAMRRGLMHIAKLSSGDWILSSGDNAAIGDVLSVNGTVGVATQAITGGSTVLVKNTNWAEVAGGALNGIISNKADKVTGATSGNFAGLDANGNLTDSGKKAADFLTGHQDISGKANAGAIAIVAEGNTHEAIAKGQYVYIKNHGTLADGLYTASSAVAANGTLSSSNTSAVSSGGLNELNSKTVKYTDSGQIYLNNLTWSESSQGKYYAALTVPEEVTGTIIGVNINYWASWKVDDIIIAYISSTGTGVSVVSNKNSFASNARIGVRILWI